MLHHTLGLFFCNITFFFFFFFLFLLFLLLFSFLLFFLYIYIYFFCFFFNQYNTIQTFIYEALLGMMMVKRKLCGLFGGSAYSRHREGMDRTGVFLTFDTITLLQPRTLWRTVVTIHHSHSFIKTQSLCICLIWWLSGIHTKYAHRNREWKLRLTLKYHHLIIQNLRVLALDLAHQ